MNSLIFEKHPNYNEAQMQFIPNFETMDTIVQKNLARTLNIVLKEHSNKSVLEEILRKENLEEAPLLRSHIWKCIDLFI